MTQTSTDGEISSAIMEVALSLDDPATRQVFLERVFGQSGPAREEMTRLLEAADGAATFFLEAREQRAKVTATILSETNAGPPVPVVVRFADDDGSFDKLGPYRLISRLGEGGGGVVYEAEQEQPIRRRVAVKIVRVDMANHSALARFDIERQALALMDHPNIAKVFDTGTTPSGRPYFAMELVTGEPITRYCNRHKLTCAERLELFVLVCNAIQHAHQKGIIHRDIKPSNVIVTRQDGANIPKIIDFGIAKAAGPGISGEAITAHDQFFGTPAYMSPEQVAMTGIDVDTRSDIFSLGVLLYELLTGTTPTDRAVAPEHTISQIRKSLLSGDTMRPSELLAKRLPEVIGPLAEERGTNPGDLVRFVRSDLDWIVMQALEKNRIRRYQTANGLATDVRRFLAHEPIAARPPSSIYVMAKFIRRNRIACGAALMLVILLIVGFGTTAAMYERERLAAAEQLKLKNEAQAARDVESSLRRQADIRSKLSRAAFLLDQGRIDEADALREDYPLSSIDPSLEAAAVFRALGDWNSSNGRRDQALQCYDLLRKASAEDNPQKTLGGDDLMAMAAAFLTADEAKYRAFRDDAVSRYSPASSRQKAEHLLKVVLLVPADAATLERLQKDVVTMGDPRGTICPAWAWVSLALYHLRSGAWDESIKACEMGMLSPERKSSCEATLQAIAAMAYASSGQRDQAETILSKARGLTAACGGKDFERGVPVMKIYWFDWGIARLLINEASATIYGTSK